MYYFSFQLWFCRRYQIISSVTKFRTLFVTALMYINTYPTFIETDPQFTKWSDGQSFVEKAESLVSSGCVAGLQNLAFQQDRKTASKW